MGTLGAIRFVVNAMGGFPGRKSVVLFTENIRLIFRGTTDEMVAHAVQQLSDAASRASVVIHAIDPRGVQDYNITADRQHLAHVGRRISRVPAQRQEEVVHTEEGMFVLARGNRRPVSARYQRPGRRPATGGRRQRRLLSDRLPSRRRYFRKQERPAQVPQDRGESERRGLARPLARRLLRRAGRRNQPLDHTREAEIVHALQSPFNAGSIHPRLTAVFSNARQSGSFINALLYFNPNELKWSNEPDGNHKASIDVAAAAFDENGLALAPVDTTFTLQLSSQNYSERLKKGMVYGIHVPVNKPGPYVVRAAVRDAATEASGSADQYVEVPDVESGHLALSGIVLQESGSGAAQANAGLAGEPAPGEDATGGAARRSFRRGTLLSWNCEIINARTGAGQHPDLEVQTRMFHDGAQASPDNAQRATVGSTSDPGRAKTGGAVSLGRDMAPGEYVLQVIVTDKLAGGKFKTVTQSIDFEIEP